MISLGRGQHDSDRTVLCMAVRPEMDLWLRLLDSLDTEIGFEN